MAEIIFSPKLADSLTKPMQRCYLLYGEDDVQKDQVVAILRGVATDPSFADFDSEELDARTTSPDNILASAGLAPFGSPYRLVTVRHAEAYRGRDQGAAAERLAAGLEKLGAASCLVLVAAAEEETWRGKTILTAKLDTAIKAHGTVIRCKPLTAEALQDWLIAEAQKCGKQLLDEAAERLIAAAHGERIALEHELAKAICYVGEHKVISLIDVEAVCSYDAEDVMFKLVDAVSQKNADRALALLQEVLRYDTKPQGVAGRLLALLNRQVRLLWQARELMERRIESHAVRNLPAETAAELPAEGAITQMAWKAGDLFRMARGWSRASLLRAFDLLLSCDLSNKGGEEGTGEVVTNLELLITRLCTAA